MYRLLDGREDTWRPKDFTQEQDILHYRANTSTLSKQDSLLTQRLDAQRSEGLAQDLSQKHTIKYTVQKVKDDRKMLTQSCTTICDPISEN